jgi:DNA-binding response OmpR family regulator
LRILIVEDDASLATSLQKALHSGGLDSDVESDGREGCDKAASGAYSLVVLDILLPAMNGFQICARLRERGISVPILMLTAKVGEWDEAEALDTGADDYLTKPVSLVVFLAHVRALLRRSNLFDRENLVLDGVKLDPVRRLCSSRGIEVTLSGREVEVLATLMQAKGEVVAKAELIDRIWGVDFEGDRNVAEVYIGTLRRKLEPAFDRRVITTVHGIGYRFSSRV